MAFGMN